MKYTFAILLGFGQFFLNAQNNLRLWNVNGEVFRLFIEDSAVNFMPQTDILIRGLKKDTVKIKAEFENKLSGQEQIYLLDKGKRVQNREFGYQLEIKNGKVKFSYSGMHQITVLPEPLVPEKPAVDTSKKYYDNVLARYVELKKGKPVYYNNMPDDWNCVTPMPPAYLAYLKILMAKAQVDDDKYAIAENTARNNCLSVGQLNILLSYIPYEIEKLKLIKTAFFSLTDPDQKHRLDSTFKLESSKRELLEFFKHSNEYKVKRGVSCIKASPQTEIEQLKIKLAVYSSDIEKLAFVKKIYTDYCYSAAQIKLLLDVFIHDREKIELAKLLYFYCVDKDNFMIISDTFSYNGSISEIKDFVSKQKN